jgi:hypothetical protein
MPTSEAFEKSVHVDSINLQEGFAKVPGYGVHKENTFSLYSSPIVNHGAG